LRFLDVISGWINRYFSHEEAIFLVVFVVGVFVVLVFLGGILAPVLAGLVLAFLLEGIVDRLNRWHVPELVSVIVTFILFLGGVIALAVFVFPLIWRQMQGMIGALPEFIERLQEASVELARSFPQFITQEQVDNWGNLITNEVGAISGTLLGTVFTNVPSLVALLIYMVLVPFAVFFFLKDRRKLLDWFVSMLPENREVLNRVGAEMNVQLANYVRGKAIEILIVGSVTFVVFTLLGVRFAAVLSVLVGLSVLVPYVGAAIVTLPVAIMVFIQFGWSFELAYVLTAYGIIQALDGNVLVPLLFSEAVDLHPISIIVAILVFGGLWGLWGVFFAIPLATLVKAIINAWPRSDSLDVDAESLN
jgi:putative permease